MNPLAKLFPQNSSEVAVRGHIPTLDGVRGVAILLVLICHYSAPLKGLVPASLLAGLQLGRHGVDLFFVLSGFLITGILLDAKDKPRYFINFYGRRSVRIFPLYYSVLIAAFVVLPLLRVGQDASGRALADRQAGLWGYYMNFVMASEGAWYYISNTIDMNHFWSLAVEEQFYLVWPLVVYLLPRRAVAWAALGLVGTALVSRLIMMSAGSNPMSVFVLTPCRLDALGAGALVAVAARDPRWAPKLIGHAQNVAAGVCVLFAVIMVVRNEVLFHTLKYLMLAGLFGGVVVMAIAVETTPAKRYFGGRFVRFLGKYSYGIYVFHIVLVPTFMALFSPEIITRVLHVPALVGGILFMVLATAASIGAAMISWVVLERPCLSLKRFFEPTAQTKVEATPVPEAARAAA